MKATATDHFRPTVLMERVSRYIEGNPLCTRREIEDASQGKTTFVRRATDRLVEEHFVCAHQCSRRAMRFHLLSPYREANDPAVQDERPEAESSARLDLLTIVEVSEYLGRPVATLYDWRYKNTGPKSAKMGGKLVYRRADLEAWVDAQFDK